MGALFVLKLVGVWVGAGVGAGVTVLFLLAAAGELEHWSPVFKVLRNRRVRRIFGSVIGLKMLVVAACPAVLAWADLLGSGAIGTGFVSGIALTYAVLVAVTIGLLCKLWWLKQTSAACMAGELLVPRWPGRWFNH